jgi:predicted nucleic acid-binding protein
MKVALDTSVLVAALVESHPRHDQAFPWLRKIREVEYQGLIAAHSVVETYTVLSTLPVSPRITPAAAWALLEHSVLPYVRYVDLAEGAVRSLVERLSRRGFAGGIVYDALIAAAAIEGGAEYIVTLNANDFRRVVEDNRLEIREP